MQEFAERLAKPSASDRRELQKIVDRLNRHSGKVEQQRYADASRVLCEQLGDNAFATVVSMIRVLRPGLDPWIRTCRYCEKFFCARRNNQEFCGGQCRKDWYSKTDKGKQGNRERQARYRRKHFGSIATASRRSRKPSAKAKTPILSRACSGARKGLLLTAFHDERYLSFRDGMHFATIVR